MEPEQEGQAGAEPGQTPPQDAPTQVAEEPHPLQEPLTGLLVFEQLAPQVPALLQTSVVQEFPSLQSLFELQIGAEQDGYVPQGVEPEQTEGAEPGLQDSPILHQ